MNTPESGIFYKGLSAEFYLDRINQLISKKSQKKIYNLDFLLITTEQNSFDISSIIKTTALKAEDANLTCSYLLQPQTCLDYNEYYKIFKMKCLVVVKYDEFKKVIL